MCHWGHDQFEATVNDRLLNSLLAVLWGSWPLGIVDHTETTDEDSGPLCRSLPGHLPPRPDTGKGTGAYHYDLLPHLGLQDCELFCLPLLMFPFTVTSNCISYLAGLPQSHGCPGWYRHQGGKNPFSCADTIVLSGRGVNAGNSWEGKCTPALTSFCVEVLQRNPDFHLDLFLQRSYGKKNTGQFNCLKRMFDFV